MFKLTVLFLVLTHANAGSDILPFDAVTPTNTFSTREACEETGAFIARQGGPNIRAAIEMYGVGMYYGAHVACVVQGTPA